MNNVVATWAIEREKEGGKGAAEIIFVACCRVFIGLVQIGFVFGKQPLHNAFIGTYLFSPMLCVSCNRCRTNSESH